MEQQFLGGGKTVHLVSEENDYWWALEVLFCLKGPFERKIPKEFSLESLSWWRLHCQPKIFQLGNGVKILPQWVGESYEMSIVPISLLASENSFCEGKGIHSKSTKEGQWCRDMFCLLWTYALPGPAGFTLFSALSFFSWSQSYLGLAGAGRGMLTRICSCS